MWAAEEKEQTGQRIQRNRNIITTDRYQSQLDKASRCSHLKDTKVWQEDILTLPTPKQVGQKLSPRRHQSQSDKVEVIT